MSRRAPTRYDDIADDHPRRHVGSSASARQYADHSSAASSSRRHHPYASHHDDHRRDRDRDRDSRRRSRSPTYDDRRNRRPSPPPVRDHDYSSTSRREGDRDEYNRRRIGAEGGRGRYSYDGAHDRRGDNRSRRYEDDRHDDYDDRKEGSSRAPPRDNGHSAEEGLNGQRKDGGVRHAGEGKADEQEDDEDPDAALMAQMMGFKGFDSTHGKHTQEDVGAAKVIQERKFRQYMNRKGGFNRPLDKMK